MGAAEVNLERGQATVDYDPGVVTAVEMEEAIRHSVLLPRMRRVIERIAGRRRGRYAQ